jgi:hypothetical protein
MYTIAVGVVAFFAFFATTASAQCGAVLQKAGPNLKIVRSGDLIGDGAREYVAVSMLAKQPKQGMYVSRLVIARAKDGSCSIVLDAGAHGPKNPVGYIGIEFIDDGAEFYGYEFEFASDLRDPTPDSRRKGDIYLTWLNPDREPEGEDIAIGWNAKVGRYQEYNLEDDSSSETFKPELRNPPHHNSKLCRKCPK